MKQTRIGFVIPEMESIPETPVRVGMGIALMPIYFLLVFVVGLMIGSLL